LGDILGDVFTNSSGHPGPYDVSSLIGILQGGKIPRKRNRKYIKVKMTLKYERKEGKTNPIKGQF
jgi:hypothetical protein